MIDLIEVEKERLLDEVSFLLSCRSISRPLTVLLPIHTVFWEPNVHLTNTENLGLTILAKWKEVRLTAQSDGVYWEAGVC